MSIPEFLSMYLDGCIVMALSVVFHCEPINDLMMQDQSRGDIEMYPYTL